MGPAEVAKEVIVKVSGDVAKSGESELSPLDRMAPPIFLDLWFFYDYHVDEQLVESALRATLGRYQELSGRWQPGKVILNNKGARFVVLEPSSLSLAEIEANDYNFDHLTQHFGTGVPMDCEFPLNLSMQRLACGGMLMVISFTHLLCDANSFYLFVADFASQMKNSTFKFSQQEVVTEERRLTLKPSGHPPKFEHPEYSVLTGDMKAVLIEEYRNRDPPEIVKLKLSEDNKQKLKSLVIGQTNNEVVLSANDCLMTVLWTAFFDTLKIGDDSKAVRSSFNFQCNSRFRRTPPIPISFFGNAVLQLKVKSDRDEMNVNNMRKNAEKMRKKILSIDNDFIQSSIDCLEANQLLFPGIPQKYDLTVTNWDKLFDWYGHSDLGQGSPKKFTFVSKNLDRTCVVLPNNDGGIEVVLGLECEHMARFVQHSLIKQYFTSSK